MSSGPLGRAASSPREVEGSANRRIAYSRDFLLSVGGSSDACKNLPAGVDASAMSELSQCVAPLGRWDASSSVSGDPEGYLPEGSLNQLDRHPGNQYGHNWQKTEHDGLLGRGAFPRPPCSVGPLASDNQRSENHVDRTSIGYQSPLLYKAPFSRRVVDSTNNEMLGSFEKSNNNRVEEEGKMRASFELIRKQQHKTLLEKKNALDSDKENLSDGILLLVQNPAVKRDPTTKVPSLPKEDDIEATLVLPTPTSRTLKPCGLQMLSCNTSLSSEIRHLSTEDTLVSSVPESSKCSQRFTCGGSEHEESLSSESLLSMVVKDENHCVGNMEGLSASGDASENSPSNCDAGYNLHFLSPRPAVSILKEYSTGGTPESVRVMTCKDLEQTMLAHVDDTTNSNQHSIPKERRTVLDEPSAAAKIAADQQASQHVLSFLQKATNSKGSSLPEFHLGPVDEMTSDPNGMVNGGTIANAPAIDAETIFAYGKNVTLGAAFTNGFCARDSPVSVQEHTAAGLNSSLKRSVFPGEGKTRPSLISDDQHFGEQTVRFSHSKFHLRRGTEVEYGYPKISGSSQEGVSFDEEDLEIQLPEEDDLYSVIDSSYAQNNDDRPSAESSRAEGLLTETKVTDLNCRFQSPDVLGSCSHVQRDQIDPNNLYHLFGNRPSAQPSKQSASAKFPPVQMDDFAHRNRQAPFNLPEAIRRGAYCSFPQDMNSMQHPVPGAQGAGQAAQHHILGCMTMPGSFPLHGWPRGAPVRQPLHHMPGYRTEMSNVNSFQMHLCQPGYVESRMMMAGPPGADIGFNQTGAIDRLIQMDPRVRSRLMHPAVASPVVQCFYGPELYMNFR